MGSVYWLHNDLLWLAIPVFGVVIITGHVGSHFCEVSQEVIRILPYVFAFPIAMKVIH